MGMNSIIQNLISKYSQSMPANYTDPNAIQQGQSVYDNVGDEYIVIEDDPTTTHKVVMPADQKSNPVPQDVKSVDDYEFSTNYSVQSQDPSDPDPNVNASISHEFIRKSTPRLICGECINPTNESLISKQIQKLSQNLDNAFNTPSFDPSVDFPSFTENPKSGYTQIKNVVENMIKQGYSDTDILITVGEKFERDLANRVLTELKLKGIF